MTLENTKTTRGDIFALGREVTTTRAISYAIVSSAAHLPAPAQEAFAQVAAHIGAILAYRPGAADEAMHWRFIAALALQMEARALGLDYTSLMDDKTLTPD